MANIKKLKTSHNFSPLIKEFEKKFGVSTENILVAVSPARVNLIGDHIDYNGGFVFPCAINLYLKLLIRKNDKKRFSYYSSDFKKTYDFEFDENLFYKKSNGFANYLNGAIVFLRKMGFKLNSGFDVLISSEIPIGSGLSSSAALETAFILAVSVLFDFKISKKEIALLGKKIENEFLGLKSGIMDQFIIANGKAETAMLLNTANLEYSLMPFKLTDSKTAIEYNLLIMNSNKPRSLVSSKYNERKAECEKALSVVQKDFSIKNLCELKLGDLEKVKKTLLKNCAPVEMDYEKNKDNKIYSFEKLYKRVKHCAVENSLVLEAAKMLEAGNLKDFGQVLTRSHASLKNDYEVTGLELDTLVKLALECEGCTGARMTGAGFSGCAIAIVEKQALDDFFEYVQAGYKKAFNIECEFYVCKSVNGAEVFEF